MEKRRCLLCPCLRRRRRRRTAGGQRLLRLLPLRSSLRLRGGQLRLSLRPLAHHLDRVHALHPMDVESLGIHIHWIVHGIGLCLFQMKCIHRVIGINDRELTNIRVHRNWSERRMT